MPQTVEKTNRNNVSGSINSDYCPPENIKMIDGRIHVTAAWIAARFGISDQVMRRVVDYVEWDYSDTFLYTTFRDGKNIWISDAGFIGIYQHPMVSDLFDETARMAMLQLLGHYRDMEAA